MARWGSRFGILPALLITASGCATPTTTDREIAEFVGAAARARGAPPAYAVVVVNDGKAQSLTGGSAGWPAETHQVGADSRFYVASVTKSYVGLLAAKLDREGVFPLDSTIGDLWPELRLPKEAPATSITLRHLLGHMSGLHNPPLIFRLANLDEPGPEAFRTILETETQWVGPAFRYGNFGFLLYVHLLERETGRSWRDWLKTEVLNPLRLDETVSDPREIPDAKLVLGHQLGPEGWVALPPKTRETMHGAGGLYTSPQDAAAWLKANLAMQGLRPEVFQSQRKPIANADVRMPGRTCSGYSLGLMICNIKGTEVFSHFGSFSGWRTSMSFSPAAKAGVYVLAASDHMAQMWSTVVENQIFDLLRGNGTAAEGLELLKEFEAEGDRYLAERTANRERGLARIAARKWTPSGADLKAYEADYQHRALGVARLTAVGSGMNLAVGAYRAKLLPAEPGVFILLDDGVTVDEVRVTPETLAWGEDIYSRVK